MSTENIYGGWSTEPEATKDLHGLWMSLAAQEGSPNFGLTQRRNEITELWQLYARQQPKVVVEIGVAQGGTFAGWCALGHWGTTIIGIDRDTNDCRPRPGEPANAFFEGKQLAMTGAGGGLYHLARARQTVHAINGWTHEPKVMARLLEILDGRKIDFLFHDASHSAEMFAEDYRLYWPLIAEGGVFAAHDINHSADPKCNKRETWRAIKETATYSACYEYLPHWSVTEIGIGVLIK